MAHNQIGDVRGCVVGGGAIGDGALEGTAGTGITLNVYGNMALAGTPLRSTVLNSTAVALPLGAPLSAELVGQVAFPADGAVYHFDCNWTGTSMGFVWIDGHMVCQDGHTYSPGAGDSPHSPTHPRPDCLSYPHIPAHPTPQAPRTTRSR